MATYNDLVDMFDAQLEQAGYTADEIADAKSWIRIIRNRSIERVLENRGTVAPLFDGRECARALLALMCAESLGGD